MFSRNRQSQRHRAGSKGSGSGTRPSSGSAALSARLRGRSTFDKPDEFGPAVAMGPPCEDSHGLKSPESEGWEEARAPAEAAPPRGARKQSGPHSARTISKDRHADDSPDGQSIVSVSETVGSPRSLGACSTKSPPSGQGDVDPAAGEPQVTPKAPSKPRSSLGNWKARDWYTRRIAQFAPQK